MIILYIGSIYFPKARGGQQEWKRAQTTHPARRLGHKYVFLIFILCFMYTYYFLLYYLNTKKVRVGKDNENGPNDVSLGHRYMCFFKNHVFYVVTNGLCYI